MKRRRAALFPTTILLVLAPVVAAPAATLLWSDDFDDGDDAGWTVVEGTWSVVDSTYRCVTTGDGRSVAGDSTWTDYVYAGRFLFDPSDPAEASLVFRVQDAAAGANQGHYYQLANYVNTDQVRLHRIDNAAHLLATVSYGYQPDTWYAFTVEVWGPFIRYWVDGSLVLQYENATEYADGRIGVKAWQSDARFDDLTVTTIDPPTTQEAIVRGVEYLRTSALAWQGANNCNGCHVQAQAIRAIGGGLARGLAVDSTGLGSLVNGMVTLAEGQDPDGCFRDDGAGSLTTDTVWGALGLADYDRLISADYRSELLAAADCLADEQDSAGFVPEDYDEPPINQGDLMATGLSAVVWDYCHQVTGDSSYATVLADAEVWLRSRVPDLVASPGSFTTQDKVMPLFGLRAAGATAQDPDVADAHAIVVADQDPDGGWRLAPGAGGTNGYATGQALLALKTTETAADSTVLSAGVSWLIGNQSPSGAWSTAYWTGARPSTFASTMWPVLALLELAESATDAPRGISSQPGLRLDVFPNPSPGWVTVRSPAEAGTVTLRVYDVHGRRVRTLSRGGSGLAGILHTWDGRDETGSRVASGVYFVRKVSGRGPVTRKVTLRID
jgi:hypothetical protein